MRKVIIPPTKCSIGVFYRWLIKLLELLFRVRSTRVKRRMTRANRTIGVNFSCQLPLGFAPPPPSSKNLVSKVERSGRNSASWSSNNSFIRFCIIAAWTILIDTMRWVETSVSRAIRIQGSRLLFRIFLSTIIDKFERISLKNSLMNSWINYFGNRSNRKFRKDWWNVKDFWGDLYAEKIISFFFIMFL